jgi:hypothetical protein
VTGSWRQPLLFLIVVCLMLITQKSVAHGSVGADGDLCMIQIGYLKAHFKIYLPRRYQREEFCEDLPEAAESLFVMEYGHDGLKEMLIDFRIIRDVTGLGKFTRQSDVEKIDDLEAATVFYQAARVEPDVYTAVQQFEETGWYIGIVTAVTKDQSQRYTAVFPFEVGFTGFGYWTVFVLLSIFILVSYLYTSGSFRRISGWLKAGGSEVQHPA